jgi:fructose-bisphosphate aldolase class I
VLFPRDLHAVIWFWAYCTFFIDIFLCAFLVCCAGLVPVVEPEILMDGEHTIDRTAEVQEEVLAAVFSALRHNGVLLEGTLLKPSMTCPGKSCAQQVRKYLTNIYCTEVRNVRVIVKPTTEHFWWRNILSLQESAEKIAQYTIRTLERTVPCSVPGIAFLSGGLSEEEASVYLNAMNAAPRRGPWALTFSFGRALQQSALGAWRDKEENVVAAQRALLARARANSEASLGEYVPGSQPSADGSLFAKGYLY